MIYPGPLRLVEVLTEEGENTRIFGDVIRFISLDGVGYPLVSRMLSYPPFNNGPIDRGWRVDPRRMTLTVLIDGIDMAHAARIRDRITRTFAPAAGSITLKITRDDLSVRCIDCYSNGEIDFPQSETVGPSQVVIIPLIAPDPSFYDPEQQSLSVTFSSSPSDIDVPVSGITWPIYPIIDIAGETDALFSFTNLASGSGVGFGAVPAGETWRFDLSNYTITQLSDSSDVIAAGDGGYVNYFHGHIRTEKETAIWTGAPATINRYRFGNHGSHGAPSGATISYYKRYASL